MGEINRKEFLKRGTLAGLFLAAGSALNGAINSIARNGSRLRGVETVCSPANTHMVGNGFRVMNFYPNGKGFEERMSPFFLLDFNAETHFPPSDIARGVGVHPHRGIETVTFAYKGSVAHHDSAGNSGVINPGDIQWMTAGGGVLHKEYHEKNFDRQGGTLEMVQLWINLPRQHKMVPARYQSILHAKKPVIKLPAGKGTIHVVAGEFQGTKGLAQAFSPVHIYDIHLETGAETTFSLPQNFNSGILVVDGDIEVNGSRVKENHYCQLKNEPGDIVIKCTRKCILLVLSGEPLNEPYVSYGPFVMNTEEEIRQAIEDYNAGKFGFLED
jgi:quercetin 2,3-dioxygenase